MMVEDLGTIIVFGRSFEVMEFHCIKCGSNLVKGECYRCSPKTKCDVCGQPYILMKDNDYGSILTGKLPYKTKAECIEHAKYYQAKCSCLSGYEILIFDDGRRFKYWGKWQPF